MIVSHAYKFVIAVPAGLNAGDWLGRIRAEGDPGHLEIIGMSNGMCVPEGCESYTRFLCDAPQHRLPQMWLGRVGTPWEGPVQVQDPNDPTEWLKWYLWGMRRKYLEMGVHASPNGWGMRGEDGDWCYFEHPAILQRVLAGQGNSKLGEDAPWGRAQVRILKMEEFSRGWRDIIKVIRAKYNGKELPDEAKSTVDLIRWHIPVMQPFYEIPDELVAAYFKENAWEWDKKHLQ